MSSKLFTLAVYAAKPPKHMKGRDVRDGQYVLRMDPHAGVQKELSMRVNIVPHIVQADSAEEARQEGLAAAREKWPPAEGWVGHTVAVSKQCLEDTLRDCFDLDICGWLPPTDEVEEVEAAELPM